MSDTRMVCDKEIVKECNGSPKTEHSDLEQSQHIMTQTNKKKKIFKRVYGRGHWERKTSKPKETIQNQDFLGLFKKPAKERTEISVLRSHHEVVKQHRTQEVGTSLVPQHRTQNSYLTKQLNDIHEIRNVIQNDIQHIATQVRSINNKMSEIRTVVDNFGSVVEETNNKLKRLNESRDQIQKLLVSFGSIDPDYELLENTP